MQKLRKIYVKYYYKTSKKFPDLKWIDEAASSIFIKQRNKIDEKLKMYIKT